MNLTNRGVQFAFLETCGRAVVVDIGAIIGIARLFETVEVGMVELRHRCDCRPPAFACHVDEIGPTDGVCGAYAAVTGLPLLEIEVCSQVANIAGEDIRGVCVFSKVLEDRRIS